MAVRHISAARGARLSATDLRAVLGFVARISEAAGPDELAEETLRGLGGLVRCDYASYVETNPRAGRAVALTEPGEAMVAGAPEALARNLAEHPIVQHYAATGSARALKMSDFLTHRQFVRTRLYDELFGPAETDYLLAARLPTAQGLVVGFSLHRRARDFSERDRAVLDVLQPHLVQAYERSLLRSTVDSLAGSAHGDGREVVALGRDGARLWGSPGADGCLERHFGPLGQEGELPRPVRAWIAAGCRSPLLVATGSLRLRIDSLGRRPAALLLTERPSAPDVAALRRLGLSRREAQVLSLAAEGRSNAEVAQRLSVGAGTVKRHLENVYAKLGVHSRTAAAAAAWAATDGR